VDDSTSRRRFPPWTLVLVLAGFVALVFALRAGLDLGQGEPRALTVAAGQTPISSPLAPPSVQASPSSSPTASIAPTRGRLVIHGAGDVSLDPGYIGTYSTRGYGYAWSGLGGLFRRDDLTVVNVECPVSNLGSKVPGKAFNFRGDPDALPAIRDAGVDVGNMANNHAYDYGPDALVDTRRNLLKAGIAPVGAGKDAAEAGTAAVFHLKGWTVAVVGIDEVIDPDYEVATPTKPGTAAGHDFDAALAEIRAAAAVSDLVLVDIHWGVELDTQPREYQVEEAHRMIDAGADVIFGGHSHRLQPVDTYKGRPIFYSLGNFVWPNFSISGSTTGVAEVTVSPKGRFTARLIPAFIEAPGHPVLRVG
jgi:poly-gamma-glutamate synthesis protein (capsule biosynthesis protein)